MADKKQCARLKELRALDNGDLDVLVAAARKSIYLIRREKLSKPQENVKATRNNRKEIARIMTIERQRRSAATGAGK